MNIAFLGLHKTGKTTYAVGVYAGMSNRIYSSLELVKVTESVATLNAGLVRLSRRLTVRRTDTEETETVGLQVRTAEGELHELRVPDRSGEALRGTRNSRGWDPDLLEELGAADALVLFIRPGGVRPGEPVAELAAIVPPTSDAGGDVKDEEERPWAPAMMPTDVSMVDALQELSQASGREVFPVAVVVSAWDEVKDLTPTQWLHSRVPLLAQYLDANAHRFPSAIFGVSVQGSKFLEPKDDEEAKAMKVEIDATEPDPWDRATCVDADGSEVELVAPLVWAIRAGG
ncbi:MAG TPA: hypothetical protein VFJ76_00760 [Solirubrobacterales bacterium]|nr:hypothetical protein [Solirubrobacterales bacterium]